MTSPVVRRRLRGADLVIGDEYFAVRTSGGGVDDEEASADT
jgi:hypothetical protein